jgi:hypothetical protein
VAVSSGDGAGFVDRMGADLDMRRTKAAGAAVAAVAAAYPAAATAAHARPPPPKTPKTGKARAKATAAAIPILEVMDDLRDVEVSPLPEPEWSDAARGPEGVGLSPTRSEQLFSAAAAELNASAARQMSARKASVRSCAPRRAIGTQADGAAQGPDGGAGGGRRWR